MKVYYADENKGNHNRKDSKGNRTGYWLWYNSFMDIEELVIKEYYV